MGENEDWYDEWSNYVQRRKVVMDIDATHTGDEAARCLLCMDHKFLVVKYKWVMRRTIPHDFDIEEVFIRSKTRGIGLPQRAGTVMVPCDCHSGLANRPDGGTKHPTMPIKQFFEYFGQKAVNSHYGQAILAHRKKLNEVREHTPEEEREAMSEHVKQQIASLVGKSKPLQDPASSPLELQERIREQEQALSSELGAIRKNMEEKIPTYSDQDIPDF